MVHLYLSLHRRTLCKEWESLDAIENVYIMPYIQSQFGEFSWVTFVTSRLLLKLSHKFKHFSLSKHHVFFIVIIVYTQYIFSTNFFFSLNFGACCCCTIVQKLIYETDLNVGNLTLIKEKQIFELKFQINLVQI